MVSEYSYGELPSEVRSEGDLLPRVSAVTSKISGGPLFRTKASQPLSILGGLLFGTVFIIYICSCVFCCNKSAYLLTVNGIFSNG